MKEKHIITGNRGPKVRSDCEVKISFGTGSGKNSIILDSKVDAMYRQSNLELINRVLDFYKIKGASCEIL